MKAFLALFCLLVFGLTAQAQVSAPIKVEVRDEGASQGRVGAINCTGSGITCSVSGDTATFNAAGGGGGSGNGLEVSINLGTSMGTVFSVTVTGQSWVTTSSFIACTPIAVTTDGQTVETYYAANFELVASNRVAATGFDLTVFSPYGATGIFRFNCLGV